MKKINLLLYVSMLFTSINAMDTEKTNSKPAPKVTFTAQATEYEYIRNEEYIQALKNNNLNLRKNMITSRLFNLQEKGITLKDAIAEEEARNIRRKEKVEAKNLERAKQKLLQQDNFYEDAVLYAFKAGLIVGGIYLISNYAVHYFKKK